MQNFGDWKSKSTSSSAIMEALNRGSQTNTSTFGSVDQFLAGLLGSSFNTQKAPNEDPVEVKPISIPDVAEINPNNFKEEIIDEEPEETEDDIINSDEDESLDSSLYKVYRDKEEIFECNISVQGAKLSSSQVRLVLDHEICNLVFYGKISKDGKCVVPLKKMSFYPEKSTGRVRLEVVVDDTIFTPWEETFIVEGAKKVTVQIKSQKRVDVKF